jgi:hypothetical protein
MKQERMNKTERAKKILREIRRRMWEMETLSDGSIMSNKTFVAMMKSMPHIAEKWHILEDREHMIERFIVRNN